MMPMRLHPKMPVPLGTDNTACKYSVLNILHGIDYIKVAVNIALPWYPRIRRVLSKLVGLGLGK
jgi:hypothetical protein